MDVRLLAPTTAMLTLAVFVMAAKENAFATDHYTRTLAPTATQISIADYQGGPSDDSVPRLCAHTNRCACNESLGCDGGCRAGCCTSCSGGCALGGEQGILGFGLVKHSEQCFSDFISPMTNPVFFEDPRNLSELRFLFINHVLPAGLGGNSVQVYAMQIRARLSDRWSLIATKDGFVATQSPILDSGFADLSAGLKYNLYRNPQKGCLLSVGATYEMPTGARKALQGNGNGEWNFFATGGVRLYQRWHVLTVMGLRQPNDENLENGVFYRSVHIDRRMGDCPLYLFTELNWTNYLNSGNAFPLSIEGGDLFNFGSPNVTGNDLVTHAVGVRAKPRKNISTGVAWEYPLTEREGILDNRITADLIFRY